MKSVLALVACLMLAASPAFAKKSKPAPAPVCTKHDDAIAGVKKEFPKLTIEADLVGDDLKRFNAFVAQQSKGAVAVPDNDALVAFNNPENEQIMLFLSFEKGCLSTVFGAGAESFKNLLKASKESGTI